MDLNYIDETAAAIRRRVPTELLPDDDRVDDLFRLYAVLALTKGAETTAEDVHNAWSAWMTQLRKSHPSVRPFDELGPDTQKEDLPFVAAIRAASERE